MSMVEWREELHPRGGRNPGWFTHSSRQLEAPAQQQRLLAAPIAKAKQANFKGQNYLQFSSGIYNQLNDGIEGIDEKEDVALSNYNVVSREINRSLRHGASPEGKIAGRLEGLCNRSRLSANVIVYRQADKNFLTAINNLKPGNTLRDDGFLTTTLQPLSSEQAMRIYAPEGSHGFVTGAHKTAGAEADEVLFAPGSRLVYEGRNAVDGVHEFTLDQNIKADAALNEAVIDVGGDMWNRETAVRLEREFVEAKPQIEQLVQDAVKFGATEGVKPVVSEWSNLNETEQELVAEQWKEDSFESEHQNAIDYWHENDALVDARTEIANDFMLSGEKEDDTWLSDAINDHIQGVFDEDADRYVGGREEEGKPRIPFTTAQIVKSLVFSIGHATNELDVEFDDKKLQEPEGYSPEQLLLPGVEKIEPASMLTEKMREDLTRVITEAFNEKADDLRDKMDPPEYLNDTVKENLDMYWDEMDDSEKFEFAKSKTLYADEQGEEVSVVDPANFNVDPLEESGDNEDYAKTQALARRLSIDRAMQLMEERDIPQTTRKSIEDMDARLWDNWKGASHSPQGKVLQAAIADELGGRLRSSGLHGVNIEETKKDADEAYSGGFEAVKAYVRAKWETTQYLLDKANKPVVDLYRGVNIPAVRMLGHKPWKVTELTKEAAEEHDAKFKAQGGQGEAFYFETENEAKAKVNEENKKVKPKFHMFESKEGTEWTVEKTGPGDEFQETVHKSKAEAEAHMNKLKAEVPTSMRVETINGFEKLPDLIVERNGAASTTTDPAIANGWGDSTSRVVLRARVPRTAIVSVPAYGQNIHSEHEVVVAGTAWIGWDSWKERAPDFKKVPL